MQVHRARRCAEDGLWQLTAQQKGGSDEIHAGFHALVLADIMAIRDSAPADLPRVWWGRVGYVRYPTYHLGVGDNRTHTAHAQTVMLKRGPGNANQVY